MQWMHRYFEKTLGILALFGGLLLVNTVKPVHAASSQNGLGFTVAPKAQNYFQSGYFKLKVQPDQQTDLTVTIANTTDQNQTIKATIENGLSSPTGNTQYTTKTQGNNTWLLDKKRALRQYVNGPTSITLAPHHQKDITYTLKLPAKDVLNDGTLLGGLSFENATNPKATNNKQHVTIYTKIARLISIEAIYKDQAATLAIGKPSVNTNPSTPLILLPLKNATTTIAKNVQLSYSVKDKYGEELFKHSASNANSFIMAPATKVKFMIPWTGKTFKPGEYTINVRVKTKTQTLHQTYPLTITNHTVKQYIKQSHTKPIITAQNKRNIFIIIALLVVIVILITMLVIDKRKNVKSKPKK